MAHKGAREDLTAEYVREILDYDPETGVFRYRANLNRRARAGNTCGYQQKETGRFKMRINGHEYMAHRLAWLWMTGKWPTHEIDHIDMDQSNNRWHNLRAATSSQNQAHRPLRRHNTSGITGVCQERRRGRWVTFINHRIIGYFKSREEAIEARTRAVDEKHGDFAHPDSYYIRR
ncbi:MAG TPA: HNH endonuclease signature motif containing protein [Candidatus Acidoferrales bacterium]|nr:HNH endonuclease signature motif containing protein [Candidatus Acidoferrales bacterium]